MPSTPRWTRFPAAGKPDSDVRIYPPVGYFPAKPSHVVVLAGKGDSGTPSYLRVPSLHYLGVLHDKGKWHVTILSTTVPDHIEPMRVAPK